MTYEWDQQHIVPLEENITDGPLLHCDTRKDFLRLCQVAWKENLELTIASGYRDYHSQRKIWNLKASGKLPIRNEQGDIVPTENLSQEQLVLTILRWSALPGFSRHHWGSDLDVFDAKASPCPQLLPQEYQLGGPYHPLFLFLQRSMKDYGFFHPYDQDRGGICPEPWHISHRPTALLRQKQLTPQKLKHFITTKREEILLSDAILKQAEFIFERFIANISK